jgi:hypothetical protein
MQLLDLILSSTGTIIVKYGTCYDNMYIYVQLNTHILILHNSSFCSTAVLIQTCFEILPYKDKK